MGSGLGFASVYFRDDSIIVASKSYLGEGTGGRVLNGFVIAIPSTIDDAEFGRLIGNALGASQQNVPMPDFSRAYPPFVHLLEVAGVKSEDRLRKTSIEVDVEMFDGHCEVTPIRYLSGKRQVGASTVVAYEGPADAEVLAQHARRVSGGDSESGARS